MSTRGGDNMHQRSHQQISMPYRPYVRTKKIRMDSVILGRDGKPVTQEYQRTYHHPASNQQHPSHFNRSLQSQQKTGQYLSPQDQREQQEKEEEEWQQLWERSQEQRWRVEAPSSSTRIKRANWTSREDSIIYDVVMNSTQKPFTQWTKMQEEYLPDRSAKAIRCRWINQLDPSIIRTPFTYEEDETLLRAQKQIGNRFSEISITFFAGRRSENQIKNRWHSAGFRDFVENFKFSKKSSHVQV